MFGQLRDRSGPERASVHQITTEQPPLLGISADSLSQAHPHPYVLAACPRSLHPLILVQIAAQGHAPDPQLFTGSWQNVRRDHAVG
jgi:hypothetical protein